MRLPLATTTVLSLCLAGCAVAPIAELAPEAGIALQGIVHGGQQPVNQAHVYLLAASSSGYGTASTSLLTSGTDGSDSIGGYVLSAADGSFSITGDYTCTLDQQVYLYALGGNPGAGTNPASGMMAAVGSCPSGGTFSPSAYFTINELSTIALAYSASGFAADPLHFASSGTALAKIGIANAFANTTNLVGSATGKALTATPTGNGTVPRTELNTLANILASCMNTNGTISGPSSPTPCYTLFNNAKSGSTLPSDTAGAAINIAHNPTANIATLFNLQTATGPFSPTLSAAPNDLTLNLTFTGGGLSTSAGQANLSSYTVNNIAIDASGNVWKPNYGTNTLSEFSPLGAPLSGSGGFSGGGLSTPANVAVDLTGNIWVGNYAGNSVSKFAPTGSPVSGSPFSGGGITGPANLTVDPSGNIWIANSTTAITKLTSAGTAVSGSPFATNSVTQAIGIAITPAGNVWVTDAFSDDTVVYTNAGAAVSGSPYTGGAQNYPYGIAFDTSARAWLADDSAITRLSATGTAGTSFNAPNGAIPTSIAIDGLGNIWVAEVGNNTILELNPSGTYISGSVGFQKGESAVPEAVAIDLSGNLWYSTCNDPTIHELVGAAAPVATPLAYAAKNSLLGQRP